MNNNNFSGRLTKEPATSSFTTADSKPGKTFKFNVAVDRNMSKAQREKADAEGKPTADFFPVTLFANGENSIKYWEERLHKGVFVEVSNAKFTTDSYEKDGNKVFTYTFVASDVKVVNTSASTPASAPASAPANTQEEVTPLVDPPADAISAAAEKLPWD